MKLTEVAAIGIRILGILLFIKMISSSVSWFVARDVAGEIPFSTATILSGFALPIIISLIAIKYPVTIAGYLVPRSSQPSAELETDGKAIQLAAFVVLGVYLVTNAIPKFIYNAMMIIFYVEYDVRFDSTVYYISELTTAIEIATGLYLMLGANGIYLLIRRLRMAGSE